MPPRGRAGAHGAVPERRDVYEQLADELRRDIVSGRYKPGDRLPSTLDLMARTGVANLTVRGAYRVLIEEGLVEPVSKRGFYVRRPNIMTWRMNPAPGARKLTPDMVDGWAADTEAAGLAHREETSVAIEDAAVPVLGRPAGERLGLAEGSRVLVRRHIRYTGPAGQAAVTLIRWPTSITRMSWSATPPWPPRPRPAPSRSWPGPATSCAATRTNCGRGWPPPTNAACSASPRSPSSSNSPAPSTTPAASRSSSCTRSAAATAPPSPTRPPTLAGSPPGSCQPTGAQPPLFSANGWLSGLAAGLRL